MNAHQLIKVGSIKVPVLCTSDNRVSVDSETLVYKYEYIVAHQGGRGDGGEGTRPGRRPRGRINTLYSAI